MWLSDFRAQFGLELETLGYFIRKEGLKRHPPLRVSDELLYLLENFGNFRTVPKLADLIAEVCGATAEQRDALVLEKYRGTWKPKEGKAGPHPSFPGQCKHFRENPPSTQGYGYAHPKGKALGEGPYREQMDGRAVVKVNRYATELARYRTGHDAAVQNCVTENQVTRRCHHRYQSDEFKLAGYTFRFAREWDAMTEAQRRADIARLNGVTTNRRGDGSARMVTVVDRAGNLWHYDSVAKAAEATGIPFHVMNKRLRRAEEANKLAAALEGIKFTYTTLWDGLTPEDQERVRRMGKDVG